MPEGSESVPDSVKLVTLEKSGNGIIDKIYKNLDSLNKKFTIIEV